MAENKHQSRECTIDIDRDNNLEEILEPGPDCCIYRVPHFLRKVNEDAYTPRLISIGPLHYGRKELMGMQNQKRTYWSKFWERVNDEQKLKDFKTYVETEEKRIRANYSVTSKLNGPVYVEMILLDAVFIIELFLKKQSMTNDFLLKPPLQTYIRLDLILLENQVPFFVLNNLYKIAFPETTYSFFVLLCSFIGFPMIKYTNFIAEMPQVKHFTDFLRGVLVMDIETTERSDGNRVYALPSATKLNKSGMKFIGTELSLFLNVFGVERRDNTKWFSMFQLSETEFRFPRLTIEYTTEGLLRNLMALEMFHYQKQTHICNYAKLMDYLIDTANDVDLLVEKGIIDNCVGDNKAIAKMFNELCSHIILSDSCYYQITEKMKAHYDYPLNHLKATLKSVYFSNLWTGTATLAAIFLIILTVIQAVCSIKQVI